MEALIPITVDGEIICAIMIGQVRDQNINLTPEEMRAFLLSVGISDTVFNDMIQSYQTMYTMNVSRFEALVYFLEICAQSIYDNRWIRRGEQSISEKFKDYIHTNLYNEISIFEAASALNISVSHLSRIIARDLNTTFTKYLNRQRMEVARLLLRTTKMNVNEIAMHLCYNDSAYFMRLFKRDTGITCTQYRASAPQLPKQQSADPF